MATGYYTHNVVVVIAISEGYNRIEIKYAKIDYNF